MVPRQNTFHFLVKVCKDMQEAACGVGEPTVFRAWPVQAEVLPPGAAETADAPEAVRVPDDAIVPEADV
eukprot:1075919-Alexandrium_andersonii.AAC.1